MDIARLTRQSHRDTQPGLRLLDQFDLAGARAHEFCGTARRRLALWLIATTPADQVIWIRPAWHPDRLHMAAVAAEVDPGRLVMVECDRAEDLLWTMEEVLRSGQVRLAFVDLIEPPGLTPVRRLHLAAETGAELAGRGQAPTGILLTPGDGGGAGVESRWHLEERYSGNGTLDVPGWCLSRRRARSAPPADWAVRRDTKGQPIVLRDPQTAPETEPA